MVSLRNRLSFGSRCSRELKAPSLVSRKMPRSSLSGGVWAGSAEASAAKISSERARFMRDKIAISRENAGRPLA